jgi:AcrR family transcriptional regulator
MATQGERREESLQRIKLAALKLFATEGYIETTLDDIAREAGLSKGGVRHYFTRKRDLAIELYDIGHRELAAQEWNILVQGDGTRDRVFRFVEHFLKWVENSPYTTRFLFGLEITKVTDDGRPPRLELGPGNVLERLIRDGQMAGEVRDGSPEILLKSFDIVRQHALEWAAGWLDGPLDKRSKEITELVWRAIRSDAVALREMNGEQIGLPRCAEKEVMAAD